MTVRVIFKFFRDFYGQNYAYSTVRYLRKTLNSICNKSFKSLAVTTALWRGATSTSITRPARTPPTMPMTSKKTSLYSSPYLLALWNKPSLSNTIELEIYFFRKFLDPCVCVPSVENNLKSKIHACVQNRKDNGRYRTDHIRLGEILFNTRETEPRVCIAVEI